MEQNAGPGPSRTIVFRRIEEPGEQAPRYREPESGANQRDISGARRRSVLGGRETHGATIREKPSDRPRQAQDRHLLFIGLSRQDLYFGKMAGGDINRRGRRDMHFDPAGASYF